MPDMTARWLTYAAANGWHIGIVMVGPDETGTITVSMWVLLYSPPGNVTDSGFSGEYGPHPPVLGEGTPSQRYFVDIREAFGQTVYNKNPGQIPTHLMPLTILDNDEDEEPNPDVYHPNFLDDPAEQCKEPLAMHVKLIGKLCQ